MSTTSLKRGDIALVYDPHSDLTTIKLRPVLAIQADNLNYFALNQSGITGIPQVVVAMISSNMARANHPARVTVSLHQPLRKALALRQDSVIMGDNIVTIGWDLVQAESAECLIWQLSRAALKVALAL